MADFQTHASCGLILAVAAGLAAYFSGAVGNDVALALVLAAAAAVGSIVPDLDSDSSVPFHLTFGLLSVAAAGAVLTLALKRYPGDWPALVGLPSAALLFVWGAIGWVFRKFTHHRGMVHSIPAALLGTGLVFLVAVRLGLADWGGFITAVSFGLGYLLHLVLDELYAAVHFSGLKLDPKQSLGSALKLYSRSRPANVAVYAAVAAIVLLNQARLSLLWGRLIGLLG